MFDKYQYIEANYLLFSKSRPKARQINLATLHLLTSKLGTEVAQVS